jgi:gamma-glutamyltranspeptidase
VSAIPAQSPLAGHPGAIRIDADGTAYGAHDPRSDGRAMSVEDEDEDVDAAP